MFTLKQLSIFILLIGILCYTAQAQELCEISMEPLKETFLYGTEPAIKIVIRNVTSDSVLVSGLFDGDHFAVIDLQIENDLDLESGELNIHGCAAMIAPHESYTMVAALTRYRISDRRSHHETDSTLTWAYPLGTFKVGAIVKCRTKENVEQFLYPTCTYSVELPRGADLVILDSIRLAKRFKLQGEISKGDIIYQKLFSEHPDSPYRHQLFVHIQGGFISKYNKDYAKSIEPRYEWTNRYLGDSNEFFPYALNRAIGALYDHYRQKSDKQGYIQRLEELKGAHKADLYRSRIDSKIQSAESMSVEKFQPVQY